MLNQIRKIKEFWRDSDIELTHFIKQERITQFQEQKGILLPDDLIDYFEQVNGSSYEYDTKLFQFYSFDQFVKITDKYKDWKGVPDYKNIASVLHQAENCYVFADYNFNLFSYAIRLFDIPSNTNEIYIVCGHNYKIIAKSFSSFLDLYLTDDISLYFED